MNIKNVARYFVENGKFVAREYMVAGRRLLTDPIFVHGQQSSQLERQKQPNRTDVINFLIDRCGNDVSYLEIGVRNPADNFDHINATRKFSVDPGIEFKSNPVDFQLTSDAFFSLLKSEPNNKLPRHFDVIFIDGLHTAEQVDRDIANAIEFVTDDGFIVVHDCNPPTEYHAREDYSFGLTPADGNWNGSTWKGFMKYRMRKEIFSCTIDTDWGIGVISKYKPIGEHTTLENEYFEYSKFHSNRTEMLGLVSFEVFKARFR